MPDKQSKYQHVRESNPQINKEPSPEALKITELEKQVKELMESLGVANDEINRLSNLEIDLNQQIDSLKSQTIDHAESEAFHKEVEGFRKLQEGVKARELKLKEFEQSLANKQSRLEFKERLLNETAIKLSVREVLVQKSEIRYTELIADEQIKIKSEALKLAYKSRLLEYKRLNFIERIFIPPPRNLNLPFKVLCQNCGVVFEVNL